VTNMAARPGANVSPTNEQETGVEPVSSQTILKGLAILEFVASQTDSVGVGEVAQALEFEKSAASRMLAALRDAGYVRQGEDRRYELTSKLLHLTRNFVPAKHLRETARAAVEQLHVDVDEAIHVAVVNGGEIVFVDFLDSSRVVRSQLPTTPAPLHLTAIGRAALSRMRPNEQRTAIRESSIAAGVTLDEINLGELEESLALARKRGYATFNNGDDVTRVAAPILNQDGTPIGGVSLSGPDYRLGDRVDELGKRLVAALGQVQS
jgi:IclR family acetate operon transcriptional repressor